MGRVRRWLRHGRRLMMTLLMVLSPAPAVGKMAVRLAGWLSGPYKARRILAQLTRYPYISPSAQVCCRRLEVGSGCFIDDGVTIFAHAQGGHVTLGERVHLYRGTIIEVGEGGSVEIGDDTHVQAGCNLKGFLRNTIIGRNVQIAPNCTFSPYEHEFDDRDAPIKKQGIRSAGNIVLEDDVWVGAGVRVLEGVRIGQGAVVGAGAVVTHDIPAFAVAAGVPARVIRMRGEA